MMDNLSQPIPSQVIVDIAPVSNAINSLITVAIAQEFPRIDPWAVKTRQNLSSEKWEQHQIISIYKIPTVPKFLLNL